MKLSELRIDSQAREQGDWHDYPELGLSFLVRGENNVTWLLTQERVTREIMLRDRVSEPLSLETQRQVNLECILEAGLLDWKGLEGDDGKPIPYSPETARQLLSDRDFDVLYNLVLGACRAMGFRHASRPSEAAKFAEDAAKN